MNYVLIMRSGCCEVSIKIMSMVWPLVLLPRQKLVLMAYAFHADHDGKKIWPSISTIAEFTGYRERNTQTITRELQDLGYLIPDGEGPKGTNKWYIPVEGGAKIAPLQTLQGAKNDKSLGAKNDKSLGAIFAPELKQNSQLIDNLIIRMNLKHAQKIDFTCWIKNILQENGTMKIILHPTSEMDAKWHGKDFTSVEYFTDKYGATLKRALDNGLELVISEGS